VTRMLTDGGKTRKSGRVPCDVWERDPGSNRATRNRGDRDQRCRALEWVTNKVPWVARVRQGTGDQKGTMEGGLGKGGRYLRYDRGLGEKQGRLGDGELGVWVQGIWD
jgi:hypothetical protein